MADRVSPGRTVHVAAGPAAVSASAVTVRTAAGSVAGAAWVPPGSLARGARAVPGSLARTAWVILAVLVFAWAGRPDPETAAARMGTMMHQASTTHADLVHLRTVVLSFLGGQRRTLLARRRGAWAWEGKD